jgi:hypothetical protein
MNSWTDPGTFQPEEIDFLQRVFDDACQTHGVTPGTAVSEDLAAAILMSYQAGMRDRQVLVWAFRPATSDTEPRHLKTPLPAEA